MRDPNVGRGIRAFSNERCRVIECEYHARPDRDAAWARRQLAQSGPVAFARSYGLSWDTPSGSSYYPEFATDPSKYIRKTDKLIPGFVSRGWDLGGNHPAMISGQWSPQQGVLWLYREAEARRLQIHDFRDLVRYLCGEIPLEYLQQNRREGALAWIKREKQTARYGVPIPWYPKGTQFVDFCGHEKDRWQSTSGKTEADVMAEVGINLIRPEEYMLEAYDRVMRFLLGPHPKYNNCRMLVDPACKEFILAMGGGLCYPKKGGDKPHKDGRFDDIHDAVKYLAAGVKPMSTAAQVEQNALLESQKAPREPDPWVDDESLVYGAEGRDELPSSPWGLLANTRWER